MNVVTGSSTMGPKAQQPQRVGLYGGSFDPLHLGHLLVAQAAFEENQLDRLIFIPTARSPFKPNSLPAPAPLRAAMLRRALAGLRHFEVDTLEIERGGISYSIDTVRTYQQRYPNAQFFWLIGADHVAQLSDWRESDVLAQAVTFIVIPRPGQSETTRPLPWKLVQLRGWPLKVSSSEIRTRISQGLPISHLVPPTVDETNTLEKLYT